MKDIYTEDELYPNRIAKKQEEESEILTPYFRSLSTAGKIKYIQALAEGKEIMDVADWFGGKR